jgi:hypothetical protein
VTATASGFQTSARIAIFLAPDNAPTNATFAATADAYVRDGAYAGDNYGSETTLQLKKNASPGYTRRAFLRFNLASAALTNFNRVYLELHSPAPPAAGSAPTLELHLVGNNIWTEAGLTWNTQPALGPTIASWAMSTDGVDRVEITSTALTAAAAGFLNLGLLISNPASDTVYSFNSREAAAGLQPQLVFEITNAVLSFNDWIAGFTNLASSASAPGDNPDGDGFNNAEEFLFNRDPARADSSSVLKIISAPGGVRLDFPQRKWLPPEMYYVIESASALWPAVWQPAAGVAFNQTGSLGGTALMSAFIPAGGGGQEFYRFRIVVGP